MRRGLFRNKKAVEEPTTADIMAVVGTIVIAVSIVIVFSVNIPSSIESSEVVLEEAETGAAARMMMSTILSSYDENLDMTGAQIISRMGADRQWAQDVGEDKMEGIFLLTSSDRSSVMWAHFKFGIEFMGSGESIIWKSGTSPGAVEEISEIIQYLPIISRNNQNVNRIKLTLHIWDSNSDRATQFELIKVGGLN
jgi:hypothetical protein